jgi:galactitol-specific phosphotransferase system IIB component
MIKKPLNLLISETEENILRLLNELNVPVKVMQLVLNEVKQNLDIQASQIISQETNEYYESLKKESEEKKDEH